MCWRMAASREALDKVHPGSPGRREVKVEARPLGEPVANQGGLVWPLFVEDQVDVEVLGAGLLDPIEELPELDGAVTRISLATT